MTHTHTHTRQGLSSLMGLMVATTLTLALLPAQAWAQKVRLTLDTKEEIVIELAADKAPKTVANFLQYVKAGHYNGTIFHRVIDGFMIQGGGYEPGMKEKATRAPIPLESRTGLVNARGTVAMARTSDPNSATAQFFINVADNNFLNAASSPDGNGYAVFGTVVKGMDVVDRIKATRTMNRGMQQNVPVQDIVIKQAIVEK